MAKKKRKKRKSRGFHVIYIAYVHECTLCSNLFISFFERDPDLSTNAITVECPFCENCQVDNVGRYKKINLQTDAVSYFTTSGALPSEQGTRRKYEVQWVRIDEEHPTLDDFIKISDLICCECFANSKNDNIISFYVPYERFKSGTGELQTYYFSNMAVCDVCYSRYLTRYLTEKII